MPGLKNSESRKDVLPKTIQCKDCGATFVFTESEQAFYQEKGFDNEPQRCPECRAARKQARNSDRGRDGYYVIA